MKLTENQKRAVEYGSHAIIVACPGSGKTRSLIAKLLRCIDELRGSSRKIACITYTNAAVSEIEERLSVYGQNGDDDYCDISTIHSFCLTQIISNFYWRMPQYKKGFSVVTQEHDAYSEAALSSLRERGLPDRMLDYFEHFNRDIDGSAIVPKDIPPEVAYFFWETLARKGLIDFPNIIYYAYRLLLEYPSISRALSSRYQWMLIDEFQDTTAGSG